MRLKLTVQPTVEPVSLEEAKLHLRVDSADDNVLISSLIKTARELAEQETHRVFITQTWRMYLDQAPSVIEIPKPPLQSIVSIKAIGTVETSVDENTDKDQPVLKVASTIGFVIGNTVLIGRDGEREESRTILTVQDGVSLTFTANLTYIHLADQADKVEKYELAEASRYYVDTAQNSYGRVKLRSGRSWPSHRGFASFIVEFTVGYGDAAADVPAALKQAILQLAAHLYENRDSVEIPAGVEILLWAFKIIRI